MNKLTDQIQLISQFNQNNNILVTLSDQVRKSNWRRIRSETAVINLTQNEPSFTLTYIFINIS